MGLSLSYRFIEEEFKMTSSSYYSNFQISSTYKIPLSLYQLLHTFWQYSYEELYEEIEDNAITLKETFSEVLNALKDEDEYLYHRRCIYMAFILALAIVPTVNAYLSNDTRIEQVWQWVIIWLEKKEIPSETQIHELFPHISEGSQAIDEALDVLINLLRVIDLSQAKKAFLEILDDCLEGYAIFPGSQGKRELFNWWLLEVVPAVWCLQRPNVIYTIKGFQTLNLNARENHIFNLFQLERTPSHQA